MASRKSLVFNCCSTPVNCTSCWVNWLVSSGSSGFWFRNCVVSNCRNVSKFCAIDCRDAARDEVLDVEPPTPLTAICALLDEQVHAAGRGRAAIQVGGRDFRRVLAGGITPAIGEGRAIVAAAIALLFAGEGVLAQREFEAGLGAVEAGLLQGAFQRALVALHQVERLGALHRHAGLHIAV